MKSVALLAYASGILRYSVAANNHVVTYIYCRIDIRDSAALSSSSAAILYRYCMNGIGHKRRVISYGLSLFGHSLNTEFAETYRSLYFYLCNGLFAFSQEYELLCSRIDLFGHR